MDRRCGQLAPAALLLLLVAAPAADSQAWRCRVEDCPKFRVIRYYEELGCVRNDGSRDCCPTSFDCSSILSADKTRCHYRGNTYEPDTNILVETENKCTTRCSCRRNVHGANGEASLTCGGKECELFPIPRDRASSCYVTTSLDDCCATGVRCVDDSESRRNLVTCPYKGRTFMENQTIEGTFPQCKRCVCQRGFDGTLDGPWCKRRTCQYLFFHPVSKLVRCAPVFREDDNCCAGKFYCPSFSNKALVIHSGPTGDYEEEDACYFGDHSVRIGYELLVGTNACIKCRCDIPPFITCTQRSDSECEVNNFGI